MNIKDQAIEYRALIQKIRKDIEDIGSLGVDTEKFYAMLDEIIESVEGKSNNREGSFAETLLIMDYSKGISMLNKLEYVLSEYNVYFVVLNTCKYLEAKLDEKMSKEEIQEYSKEVIEMLDKLRYSSTVKFEEEQEVVEMSYKVAYQFIKLELVYFGESKIYEASKDQETDCTFFDKFVSGDVDKIDLRDSKNKSLKLKVFELKKNGLGSSLFDIELIKMLIALDPNSNLLDKTKDDINALELRIKELEKRINSLYYYYKEEEESLDECLKEKKDSTNDFTKSILSVFLSFAIYSGIFTSATLAGRLLSVYKEYEKSGTSYSEEYGEDIYSYTYKRYITKKDPKDGTYIRVYESDWSKKGNREVKVYDVSNFELENLAAYLTLPLEDLEYETEIESLDEIDQTQVGRTNYKMVETASYKYEGKKIDKSSLVSAEILLNIIALFIVMLSEYIKLEFNNGKDIFSKFEELSDNFYELKSDGALTKAKLKSLSSKAIEILTLINGDEKLKEEFNRKIRSNKELICLCLDMDNILNGDFEDTDKIKNDVKRRVKRK